MAKYYYDKYSAKAYWRITPKTGVENKIIYTDIHGAIHDDWNSVNDIRGIGLNRNNVSEYSSSWYSVLEFDYDTYPSISGSGYKDYKIDHYRFINDYVGKDIYAGTRVWFRHPSYPDRIYDGVVTNDSASGYSIGVNATKYYTPKFSYSARIYKNYAKDTFISQLQAEDGVYPDDGLHTDGYWYVKKGLVFPSMKIRVDGSLKTSVDGWVKVNGTLKHIDSMWAKVDGVLKKL